MLVYLASLVVGVNAALQAGEIRRLAWSMSALCDDFKAAVDWYPELPPPEDTHETKERINRVTYEAVWRAMPPLRIGEKRKEQYGEEWWQWMSSSWSQRISYAALNIETGEECARKSKESWEEYEGRVSSSLWGMELAANMFPATLSSEGSVDMQEGHASEPTDFMSSATWLSMGKSLVEAVSRMDPGDLGPLQKVNIDGLTVVSLSSNDIMQQNPEVMQFLTEKVDGMPVPRFHKDGQMIKFAPGQSVNFTGDTVDTHFNQQSGIRHISVVNGHIPNASHWSIINIHLNMDTAPTEITMYMPSKQPGISFASTGEIDVGRLPKQVRMALEGLVRVKAPVSSILLKNPGDTVHAPLSASPILSSTETTNPNESSASTKFVLSQMTGLIASIAVSPGSTIAAGAELMVIEVMKMLITISSPRTGKVKSIHVEKGQLIGGGQLLLEFEH